MGYQIIVQPDEKLAIFSTFEDGWVVYDADRKEVIKFFVDIAKDDAKRAVKRILEKVEDPENSRPYAQFTMTFEEANEKHLECFDPLPFINSCGNPECPNAGNCGGACVRDF